MRKNAMLTVLISTAFGCASTPPLTNEDAMAIRQRQGAPPADQLQLTQQQIATQRQINAQAQAQAAAYWQQFQTQQSQQPPPPPPPINLYTPQVKPIGPPSGNVTCIRSGVLTTCEASSPQSPSVAPPSTITCIDSGPVTNCRY